MDQQQHGRRYSWKGLVFGRNPRRTFWRIVALVAVSVVAFRIVFMPIRVQGTSMEPNYEHGSLHLVNRLAYVNGLKPERGDVVSIRVNRGRRLLLMKRVVGLPGERVTVVGGLIAINGSLLKEPYVKWEPDVDWERGELVLGPDSYFVAGDNREGTVMGDIHISEIIGKVVL